MKKSLQTLRLAAISLFLGISLPWFAATENLSAQTALPRPFQEAALQKRTDADDTVARQHVLLIEPNDASRAAAVSPLSQEEAARLYKKGEAYLTNGQWQDAKLYYEKVLKKYPENGDFHQAYLFSRAHLEVENRYRDASFCHFLASTDKDEVMALCDDVLKNIQTWYVDAPDWNTLFQLGVVSFKIALTEKEFLRQNRVPVEYDARLPQYGDALIAYASQWNIASREELLSRMLHIAESVQKNVHISGISVLMEILCGMVNSLDAYSAYLTGSQINDIYSMIDGHFIGLGVYIESRWQNGALQISKVIPSSPAARAGLAGGDLILEIDGRAVTEENSPEEAGTLLQGPEGTEVVLLVQSAQGEKRRVGILRKSFDIPSVEDVKYLPAADERKIGFFKINAFQKTTVDEVKKALIQFDRGGLDCLIIDLRNNPGGLLDKAVELSNLFLDRGTIVRTKGRMTDQTETADSTVWCRVPMILLLDENSASAAEIFAGAIQENGRGTVVGTPSFGKGTVQVIIQLASTRSDRMLAGLRLTTEKFYSPRGRSYSGVGVIPDIDVTGTYAAARPESARAVSLEDAQAESVSPVSPVNDIFLSRALEESESLIRHQRSL
ncbi:MAG: PDZ domain-containing protein [Thermoguttaceae bacterium]|nr:PDZ domain-containing protein [Thermoguttaceae bacterium]